MLDKYGFERRLQRPHYMPEWVALLVTSRITDFGGLTGCWIHDGAKDAHGYGKINEKKAHRVVYTALIGEIPEGLVIDHLCRVRDCLNPWHMEPVTIAENVRRGASFRNPKGDYCKNRHFREWKLTKKGHLRCAECMRESQRRLRAARKAAQ